MFRSAALCLIPASFALAADPAPPKFSGLGKHTRTVATGSHDAQAYFDQGLAFLFAFNHDEAIRAFGHAAALDPGCAMAHWGVAIANGGHINRPVVEPARAKAAHAAVQRALEKADAASAADRALIDALAKRYADPLPEDRAAHDKAYSAAI